MCDRGDWGAWHDPQRHGRPHPAEAALGVLRAFDVLDGMRLTPLGEWARDELRRVVPPSITPDMMARELLTQLAGADGPWDCVGRWIGGRTAEHIVDELVAAATDATPAEHRGDRRDRRPGAEAVAALRVAADDAPLAAHARDIAHRYELAPEPGVADMVGVGEFGGQPDHVGDAGFRCQLVSVCDVAGVRGEWRIVRGDTQRRDRLRPQAVDHVDRRDARRAWRPSRPRPARRRCARRCVRRSSVRHGPRGRRRRRAG